MDTYYYILLVYHICSLPVVCCICVPLPIYKSFSHYMEHISHMFGLSVFPKQIVPGGSRRGDWEIETGKHNLEQEIAIIC